MAQPAVRLGTTQNLSSTAASTPTVAFGFATTQIRVATTAAVNFRIGSVAIASVNITAATWASTSGGQATFTTAAPHTIAVGSIVTIASVLPTGYNGTYATITGTTGSTIVVALPLGATPGTYVSGGTAVGSGPPTAVAADALLPANTIEYFIVSAGQYLASIGTATVNVTECS